MKVQNEDGLYGTARTSPFGDSLSVSYKLWGNFSSSFLKLRGQLQRNDPFPSPFNDTFVVDSDLENKVFFYEVMSKYQCVHVLCVVTSTTHQWEHN